MTATHDYADQLDPELLERVEAWRAEQARAHEVDDEPDVDPEVLELFEQAEAGNYGRVAKWDDTGENAGSSFTHDGRLVTSDAPGHRHRRAKTVRKRELGQHAAVVRSFLIEGGWNIARREPTGGAPGRPRPWSAR